MRAIIDIIKLKVLDELSIEVAKPMKLCTLFTDLEACQFMIAFIF
jgi:hypothetical protein